MITKLKQILVCALVMIGSTHISRHIIKLDEFNVGAITMFAGFQMLLFFKIYKR